MESINNKIRRAVKGEEDALEFIHQHYLYIADKFYEKNKNITSKKELYLIIEESINDFCNIETNVPLILYIYKRIEAELNKKKELKIDVKKSVLLACQGDLKAREDLINHYYALMVEKAKKYNYIEYEELVQFGALKLIEYIDILISEHQNSEFCINGIGRSIEIYFDRTLRKYIELCNTPLTYVQNDLEKFKAEYEFSNLVDSLTTNTSRRDIIKKYFFERKTLEEIAENHNMSHESVRKIVKLYQPQLKKNYLK